MTLVLSKNKFEQFRDYLAATGYSFEERPHQFFLARKDKFVVSLYNSGKIVLAGKNDAEKKDVQEYLGLLEAKEHVKSQKEYAPIDVSGTRIGTDEVGKGDYFGPLIIAGVMADEAQVRQLQKIGIKDSKNLSDTTIRNLAVKLRDILQKKQYTVITIKPLKYNLLQRRMGNVNGILGWGHARAIENLLAQNALCKTAVADQFGDRSYIEKALMRHGRKIALIQTPKAEREITVAAASILARSAFIDRMNEMGETYGETFPKGATNVIPFARQFVETYGSSALLNVAKIHFKTTLLIEGVSHQNLAIEPIEQLEEAKPATANFADRISHDILLECYHLISTFEQAFRRFIVGRLEVHYGSDWWQAAIQPEIRQKVEPLLQKAKRSGEKREAIDCLSMDQYRLIITEPKNWRAVFRNVFNDKEMFVARLKILKEVRNAVAHSRRTFEASDRLDVISSIRYFYKIMQSQANKR